MDDDDAGRETIAILILQLRLWLRPANKFAIICIYEKLSNFFGCNYR